MEPNDKSQSFAKKLKGTFQNRSLSGKKKYNLQNSGSPPKQQCSLKSSSSFHGDDCSVSSDLLTKDKKDIIDKELHKSNVQSEKKLKKSSKKLSKCKTSNWTVNPSKNLSAKNSITSVPGKNTHSPTAQKNAVTLKDASLTTADLPGPNHDQCSLDKPLKTVDYTVVTEGIGSRCHESHAESNNSGETNLIQYAVCANPLAAKRCSDSTDCSQSAASSVIETKFIDKNCSMNESNNLNERGVTSCLPTKNAGNELELGANITHQEMGAKNTPSTDVCSTCNGKSRQQQPSPELSSRSGAGGLQLNNVIILEHWEECHRSKDFIPRISNENLSVDKDCRVTSVNQTILDNETQFTKKQGIHSNAKLNIENTSTCDKFYSQNTDSVKIPVSVDNLGSSKSLNCDSSVDLCPSENDSEKILDEKLNHVISDSAGNVGSSDLQQSIEGSVNKCIIIDSEQNLATEATMGCGLSRDYNMLNESSDYHSFINNVQTRNKARKHSATQQCHQLVAKSRGMKNEEKLIRGKHVAGCSTKEFAELQSVLQVGETDKKSENEKSLEIEECAGISRVEKKIPGSALRIAGQSVSADLNVYVKRPPYFKEVTARDNKTHSDSDVVSINSISRNQNGCQSLPNINFQSDVNAVSDNRAKLNCNRVTPPLTTADNCCCMNAIDTNQSCSVHSSAGGFMNGDSGIHDSNHQQVIERQRCGSQCAVCSDTAVNEIDVTCICRSNKLMNGEESERTKECSGCIHLNTTVLQGKCINSNNTDKLIKCHKDGLVDIDLCDSSENVSASIDCVHSQTVSDREHMIEHHNLESTPKMKHTAQLCPLEMHCHDTCVISVIDTKYPNHTGDLNNFVCAVTDNNNSLNCYKVENCKLHSSPLTGNKLDINQSLRNDEYILTKYNCDPKNDKNQLSESGLELDLSFNENNGVKDTSIQNKCDNEVISNLDNESKNNKRTELCHVCGQDSGIFDHINDVTMKCEHLITAMDETTGKNNLVRNQQSFDPIKASEEPIHVNIQQLLNFELQQFADSIAIDSSTPSEKTPQPFGHYKPPTVNKLCQEQLKAEKCSRNEYTDDNPPPIPERTYLMSPERTVDNELWDIGSSCDSDDSTDEPLVFENLSQIRKSKANEYIESDCIKEFTNRCARTMPEQVLQGSRSPSDTNSIDIDSSHLCTMFNSLAIDNPCYCDNLELIAEAEGKTPNFQSFDYLSDFNSSDTDCDAAEATSSQPPPIPELPKCYENKTYNMSDGKEWSENRKENVHDLLPEHPPLYQEINRTKKLRKSRPKTAVSKEELENKDFVCTCHLYNGKSVDFKPCLRHPYLEVAPPPIPKRNYNLKVESYNSRSGHTAPKLRAKRDIIRQERVKVKSLPPLPTETISHSTDSHLKLMSPLQSLDLSPGKTSLQFGRSVCDSTTDEVTHLSLEELVGSEPVIPPRLTRTTSHNATAHHGSPPVTLHLPSSRHSFVTPPRKTEKSPKIIVMDKKSPNSAKTCGTNRKVVRSISLENPHTIHIHDISPEKSAPLTSSQSVKEKRKNPLSALGKLFTKKTATKCDRPDRKLPPVPGDDLSPLCSAQGRPFHPIITDLSENDRSTQNFIDSLLKLREVGWYWGPLSLEDAEAKLQNKKDGSFLVRDSSHDSYILSLSFRSQGKTHHTRIEHCQGTFGFWSQPVSHGRMSIIEFIDKAMEHSRNGKFLYFLRPHAPGLPPSPVALLYPISRFELMQSLQHRCRFIILKHVRYDHINQLPLPQALKQYLREKQYFTEKIQMSDHDSPIGSCESD